MAKNIYLYDFNGSIRRNKKQEAMFKDLAQKDDFLKRMVNERAERHLLSKKNAAALKIQAAFRSYYVRKQVFSFLRAKFDSLGRSEKLEVLEHQVGRLSFFFNKTEDMNRTISLCSDAVACCSKGDSVDCRRRRQLMHCTLAVMQQVPPNTNYVPLLRYVEKFLDSTDFNSEDFCTVYYDAVLSLFINQFSLPEPVDLVLLLPPRADSVLHFLLLPLKYVSSDLRPLLHQKLLLSLIATKSQAHMVCYVLPFLARKTDTKELCFSEVIKAFSVYCSSSVRQIDENLAGFMAFALSVIADAVHPSEELCAEDRESLINTFGNFIKRILALRNDQQRQQQQFNNNIEMDSEDEDVMDSEVVVSLKDKSVGSFEYFIEYISKVLAETSMRLVFVESTLESDNTCVHLAAVIDFLRIYSTATYNAYLNTLSLCRSFVTRLWHSIVQLKSHSLFTSSRTLLSILENGECISSGEEVLLMPMLSLFVNLFTKLLTTTDDDDFVNGSRNSSTFPFDSSEIVSITSHFRDLALGLIDMVFPIAPPTSQLRPVQSEETTSKWSAMFKQVTVLTKMLYERECRLHFMTSGYWSSHNRQVVVSSSLWRVGQKQRRVRGRPFEFVRFLVRERNADDDEEPPTAIELRNLSILLSIPFVLRFLQRVEIFTELIMRDKAQSGHESFRKYYTVFLPLANNAREAYHVTVHRNAIYEDAFAALTPAKAPDLRNVLRIQMVNWSGLNEAGVDGGGIFREFMSELLQTIVDPARGFFTTTRDQMLYPNPLAMSLYPDFQDHFYFIGRIIAKLIYEGLLADLRFADFFILQWFSPSGIEMLDLEYVKSYDPLVHENLKYLKYCSTQEVDALELDFSVLIDNLGVTEKVKLKKDGDEIRVTAENRTEYIALYVNYFLSKRISPMLNALRAGVRSVINLEWLSMFSPAEISMLIGGVDADIDFSELRKFSTVHNIQSDSDKLYIESFWMVLDTFSNSEKRKFLKFVTGCPRPPLMGFKALNPPMGVQLLHQEVDRLPTAGTCMNLLKLPVYPDYETLRDKLYIAINAGAGFELS